MHQFKLSSVWGQKLAFINYRLDQNQGHHRGHQVQECRHHLGRRVQDHQLVPELRLCGWLRAGWTAGIMGEFCLGGIPQISQVFHRLCPENITDENTCNATTDVWKTIVRGILRSRWDYISATTDKDTCGLNLQKEKTLSPICLFVCLFSNWWSSLPEVGQAYIHSDFCPNVENSSCKNAEKVCRLLSFKRWGFCDWQNSVRLFFVQRSFGERQWEIFSRGGVV